MLVSDVLRAWRDGRSLLERASFEDVDLASTVFEVEEARLSEAGRAKSVERTKDALDAAIYEAEMSEAGRPFEARARRSKLRQAQADHRGD